MSLPVGPLQQALYARLNGDATLGALISGVFDEVPEGQAKPYLVIGEAFVTPRHSQDRLGWRIAHTFHTWSDHHGMSEVNTIQNRVVELLQNQALTVAGYDVVLAKTEFGQALEDPDPAIRHGVLRVAFTVEETL